METSRAAVATTKERPTPEAELAGATWRVPVAVATIASVLVVLLFYDTYRSIVAIWARSDTFAHGYLILPISVYLIWEGRGHLRRLAPSPNFKVLPLIALVGFGWLACRLAGVLVLEQYLAVAAIPLAVWGVLGNTVMRQLAFPLGFLLLGVPIGEVLIPPLIDFTASFTVAGLRLTGVPVLRDGNLLTLSSSRWSVVEACSGLRYLIACLTLGILYAHLTYRSWLRRGLCVLAAIIVPIIANGFRAYMIVMMGHLSDMRLAVGVDHLIYGWIFFGLVVLLFFWVGSFFREDEAEGSDEPVTESPSSGGGGRGFVAAGVCAVVIASVWPAWAGRIENDVVEIPSDEASALPAAVGGWVATTMPGGVWQPHYVGADVIDMRRYRRGDEWLGLHAACYAVQHQGAELVNSSNLMVSPDDKSTHVSSSSTETVSTPHGSVDVLESILSGGDGRTRAWKFYWIEGTPTASPYYAKLLELVGKLGGSPPLACGITVFTPDDDGAVPRLKEFVGESLGALETSLAAVPRAR